MVEQAIEDEREDRLKWQEMMDVKLARFVTKESRQQDLDKKTIEPIAGVKATLANASCAAGNTAVVGGFKDASSFEAARDYLSKTMKDLNIQYSTMRHKGKDDLNGVLFVRFVSAEARDDAIFHVNDGQPKESKSKMRPEKPPQDRAKFIFLIRLKKLLQELGTRVSFGDTTYFMKYLGEPIIKIDAVGFSLSAKWLDPEWAAWKDLVDFEKCQELLNTAQSALDHAEASKGGGEGVAA